MQNGRPDIWVQFRSFEYQLFLERLKQNATSSHPKGVCTKCWAFMSAYDTKAHPEHRTFFQSDQSIMNESNFLNLAKANNKLRNDSVSILYARISV